MIDAIAIVLAAGCGLGLIGCVWALICNERTYRHRMKLIDWVYAPTDKTWMTHKKAFDAVSYDDHLWALFFFRDPKALYKFEQDAA